MTDFATLAAGIAAALNGTIRTHDAGGDPIAPNDRGVIDLNGEYAGLVVVLRQGYGADCTRIRATMSQTMESRDGCDYRETPDLHTLETAAAMSRGAPAIARQIASKLLPTALEKLEAFKVKRREHHAHMARLSAAVDRWKAAFPKARVSMADRDHDARFELSTGHLVTDYAYVSGRINADGGLHIDRMSTSREADAMAFVESHMANRV